MTEQPDISQLTAAGRKANEAVRKAQKIVDGLHDSETQPDIDAAAERYRLWLQGQSQYQNEHQADADAHCLAQAHVVQRARERAEAEERVGIMDEQHDPIDNEIDPPELTMADCMFFVSLFWSAIGGVTFFLAISPRGPLCDYHANIWQRGFAALMCGPLAWLMLIFELLGYIGD